MATAAEMQQFVSLWSLVMQVQRSNEPDQFTWRFTTSGVYTSSSAYRAQFHGSYAHYEWNRVWKAPVEPKCKFFSWLLLQNKLWTADWLARHGNPANTICQLCHTQQETAFHITAQCTFSTAVWTQLANWMGITSTSPQLSSFNSLKQWWTAMTTTGIGDLSKGRVNSSTRCGTYGKRGAGVYTITRLCRWPSFKQSLGLMSSSTTQQGASPCIARLVSFFTYKLLTCNFHLSLK
jgi:hypothetical protein